MASSTSESAELTELRERLGEIADLGTADVLLGWDRETVMPPAGAQARGEVSATIEKLGHQRLSDPAIGELLASVAEQAAGDPESDAAAIARVVRRDHDRAVRVPSELVAEMARATAAALPAWQQARESSKFERFRPFLERNVELRRQVAACFPEVEHPYDALLDVYEPGATVATVRDVFDRLRAGLVPLVAQIAERPEPDPLPGPFGIASQRELALEIARSYGYEDDAWRVDDSVHPFMSNIARSDIRVTSRWSEEDLSGVFSIMHEVGHGLYEAGVDPALDRTTLGTGVSLGIHESQSRLWENQVGRSGALWSHWLPRAQQAFPQLDGIELDAFLRAVNVVRPSLIRVEADEATYALHVILRFELEVALIEGSLAVADVPAAWNEQMRELLGVEVPDDANGCLQDIHWAFGELGYFPTYALGNIVSGQLWAAARAAQPSLEQEIAAGDASRLLGWLRENVHAHGRRLDPAQLLRRATGQELDPEPQLDYLREKYSELYSL
jgi:carboxypeptidase Taq